RDPIFDASVNIIGFLNLLESMLKCGIKKLVYVSTGGAIYGEPKEIPVQETAFENPISAYGLSKLVGERYLKLFHETYGISYSIIRPANIYGPRQDPMGEAGVISIFLGNFLNKKPVVIFGDGYDTRDYIYVKDITNMCIKAMHANQNATFNAGTGIQTNLIELVNTIEKVTEMKTIRNFESPRPGDVKHISLDSSKAKNKLNWEPKVSLEKGIKITWDWFRDFMN
ncbi:GDP-mannose 4,6-dehydratase, partial [Candidatus Hodarchaeum mangrovi]